MKKYIILSVAYVILTINMFGQDQLINQNTSAEAEFHTAINPIDSNNVVLVTMRGAERTEDSYFTIYYTKDFGETWQQSDFQGRYAHHIGTADPVLAFSSSGDLTLAHLVYTEDNSILTALSESKDYGETWNLRYEFEDLGFTDKPWVTIDISEISPNNGMIYVPTVDIPIKLLSFNADYTLASKNEVVGSNHIPCVVTNRLGDVFVSGVFLGDPIDLNQPIELYVNKYSDAGTTLDHSTYVTTFPNYIYDADDISHRFQPTPYMAIDNSEGPYSGRIYLSYTASELTYTDYFNVFLTHSDDDGLTWAEPKVVHSDTHDSIQQFYSSIYVNDNGVLLLDWYDRTNYIASDLNTDFFLGVSHDGGENFTEYQLNSEAMDFTSAVDAGFGFGIGDYHQLVATKSQAISFWSDGRTNDGDLNIFFAKVNLGQDITTVSEQSMINDKIAISDIYPQPVYDNINFTINLMESFRLKFDLFSIDGSLVSSGTWTDYETGSHDVNIPIYVDNGQYILNVTSSTFFFKNKKFIVLK